MYTHAVITYSKVHYLLTQSQWEALEVMEPDHEIKLEGGYVKAANIADRMTIEKYYETFPQKRPEEVRDDFKANYGNMTISEYSGEARRRMKASFIQQQRLVGYTEEEAEARFEKCFKWNKKEKEKGLVKAL